MLSARDIKSLMHLQNSHTRDQLVSRTQPNINQIPVLTVGGQVENEKPQNHQLDLHSGVLWVAMKDPPPPLREFHFLDWHPVNTSLLRTNVTNLT